MLLLVDGVYGFGVEREIFPELGCDFFIAGCHKLLYGPPGIYNTLEEIDVALRAIDALKK